MRFAIAFVATVLFSGCTADVSLAGNVACGGVCTSPSQCAVGCNSCSKKSGATAKTCQVPLVAERGTTAFASN